MSGLKVPKKGEALRMLQDLNAEHAQQTAEATGLQDYNVTSNERTNVTTNVETNEPAQQRTHARSKKEAHAGTQEAAQVTPGSEREERIQRIRERAENDEVIVATIRVPACLHEYLDRYVSRVNENNPKAKYRKQDAILEAFLGFVADHPMPPRKEDDLFE